LSEKFAIERKVKMHKIKKIHIFVFLIIMISLVSFAAQAKTGTETMRVTYKQISLHIDGENVDLYDANGIYIEPFIWQDTTYLPLRAVAEALNMEVKWDQASYSVYLSESESEQTHTSGEQPVRTKGTKEFVAAYHDIRIFVDNEQIELYTPGGIQVEPFIADGTTYLPLRNVAEAIKASVQWDGEENRIYLDTRPKGELRTQPLYDIYAETDMPLTEAQEYGFTVDMEKYSAKGYAYITLYDGEVTDVLIPSKIEGRTTYLKNVSGEAPIQVFSKNEHITSVTFEEGVICDNYTGMFSNCSKLEYVYNMPDGTGGMNCFAGCKSLRYVDYIPRTLTSMYNYFQGCRKIEKLDYIPGSVLFTMNGMSDCVQLSGDIICEATDIENAVNMFKNTVKPINLHVPYPSKSYTAFEAAELPSNVTLIKTENKIAYLPKEICVATYSKLNLYNFAVCPDYEQYSLKWDCEVGAESEKGFVITGTEANIGQYPIRLEVADDKGVVYSVQSTVKIVSSKISKTMKVVTIGDAYTYGGKIWMNRVNSFSERIQFVGTRAAKHEGRTSYGAKQYLEYFEYKGDTAGLNEKNPFFNPDKNHFDWSYYRDYTGIYANAVQIFLGRTGLNADPTENAQNIKAIVDYIRQDDSEIPIYIVNTPYMASTDSKKDKMVYNLMVRLDELLSEEHNLYFVPIALTYDKTRYYNPKNKTMPDADGYSQFGDCMFGAFAANLQ